MPADRRPRVEIRMPHGAGTLQVPLVRLEQRSSGAWAAVVALPRYVDLGRIGATDADNDLAAWEEHMPVPAGEYRDVPGQDYSRITRVPYRDPMAPARPPGSERRLATGPRHPPTGGRRR